MIKGISIQLLVRDDELIDEFNHTEINGEWVTVSNVLVGEPSTEDVTSELNLTGKHVSYVLAIPKEDNHSWEDTLVKLPSPFNATFRTIGYPTVGIESMIPLYWNKKVKIERYE